MDGDREAGSGGVALGEFNALKYVSEKRVSGGVWEVVLYVEQAESANVYFDSAMVAAPM